VNNFNFKNVGFKLNKQTNGLCASIGDLLEAQKDHRSTYSNMQKVPLKDEMCDTNCRD
jgi:hypothetical protein